MKKGRQIRSCVLSRKMEKYFSGDLNFPGKPQKNNQMAIGHAAFLLLKTKKASVPSFWLMVWSSLAKGCQHWHYSKSLHFGKRQKNLHFLIWDRKEPLQILFLVGLKPFPNSSLWEIGKDRRPKLTWQVGLEIRRQHLGYFTPSLSFSKNVFFLCSTFNWGACAEEDGEKWISLTFPILETFL